MGFIVRVMMLFLILPSMAYASDKESTVYLEDSFVGLTTNDFGYVPGLNSPGLVMGITMHYMGNGRHGLLQSFEFGYSYSPNVSHLLHTDTTISYRLCGEIGLCFTSGLKAGIEHSQYPGETYVLDSEHGIGNTSFRLGLNVTLGYVLGEVGGNSAKVFLTHSQLVLPNFWPDNGIPILFRTQTGVGLSFKL